MYANLKVTATDRGGDSVDHFAWSVEVEHDGSVVIHTDRADGRNNYAVPGPDHHYPAGTRITISADF